MEYKTIHNEKESRFETEVEGLLCLIDYEYKDGVYIVTHTEVPPQLEGRGIAGAMTKAMLDYIQDNGQKVNPICPYTKVYIQRHPEYADLLG